ncbi:MAG: phosphatase PAP2 family protein [Clostridia bacterium]|nr:phosphatase PAP2 family protein [Clostridia bacterium]
MKNSYETRKKLFCILAVFAILTAMLVPASVSVYADEESAAVAVVEEPLWEETPQVVAPAPDDSAAEKDAADTGDVEAAPVITYGAATEEGYDIAAPAEDDVVYQTYSETETVREQTAGDKLDEKFFGLDTAIYRFFGKLQNPVTLTIAKIFTSVGDTDFGVPVAILCVVLCLFKRTRKYGLAVLLATAVGLLIVNFGLKPAVLRIRPYNTLQLTDFWSEYSVWYKAAGSLSESDYSFPSGHSNAAFAMATAMFLCLLSNKKGKIAWIFPLIALGTACSRIMVMVHYPTDVIFGSIAGIVSGVIGYCLALLVCKLFDKVGFLSRLDVEKKFKNGINNKAAVALVTVVCLCALGVSFGHLLTETDEQKCAYNAEYDCNNKARIDSEKYPPIDGEYYCKIHWKQLNGEE